MNSVRRLIAVLTVAALALAPLAPARATVNSSVNKTIVLGNGSQTQFSFSFIGVATAYISVILTDSGGNETVLTQGAGATQYQIALNAPVPGAIWGLGGTVTYNPSGTPVPAGSTLTIFRTLPLTQAISLANQSSVQTLGKGSETGLDTGVMQGQQIAENIGRAIVAPIVDPSAPLPLPPVAQRANQAMGFDSLGNPIAMAAPASGMISSAMQPVVDAASLAAGRAAFGLGAMAQEGIGAGLQDDGSGNARVNSALTSVATNQTVDASFAQRTYVATGPINFTLGRANTLWNGFAFTVYVLASPVTLIPDANDSVQGQATGASVAIPANSVATITADGAAAGNWHVAWTPWNIDGTTKSLITPVAFGAVRGLVIANNAGTPNTKIDTTIADAVMVNTAGYGIKASSVSFTVDLTTGTVVSTANGLDGEAIPANGTLFLWAISNGATTAGLASTSSTAPTLPTGYTFKKYIGAMVTASSILKRTRQLGRDTQYQITTGSNTTAPPVIASATSATAWTAIATGVPSTAAKVNLIVQANIQTGGQIAIAPNNNYSTVNNGSTTGVPCSYTNSTGGPYSVNALCAMNLESSNIYWGANVTGSGIFILGWTDNSI